MIPQPFIRGAGERVFFGKYEYPSGADLIFDFGNPLCTSAFGSNLVYNIGSANVTGSLIPYNNPGPIYPTLSTAAGGVMITRAIGGGAENQSNFLQWDWKSTAQQTNVYLFSLNGAQLNPWSSFLPQSAGANSIRTNVYGNTVATGSATVDVRIANSSNAQSDIYSVGLNMNVSNNRNGYNFIGVSANQTNSHLLYINDTPGILDTTTIARTNSGTQTTKFGVSSNMRIMAFLQYPKILTSKEIRQIYKVFSPRFFT